jgi:S1-C subfamily serine protease
MRDLRTHSGLVLVAVLAGMATAAGFVVVRTLRIQAVQAAAPASVTRIPAGRYSKPSAFGNAITAAGAAAAMGVKLSATEIAQRAARSMVTVTGYDAADKPVSQGVGYVYASSGLIVTTLGAIRGASSVVIDTASGDELNVIALMGYNPGRDLAALAVLEGNLPALESGPGEIVQEGDSVFARGTAMTIGPRRAIGGTDLIQTNAVSTAGTPVLNEQGKVIGIARRDGTILPSRYVSDLLGEKRVLSFEQLQAELQSSR